MSKNSLTRKLAYMAIYIALYVVLKFAGDLIPILKMPNGGSIELELIAVFIASYHLGWKDGACVAVLSWIMTIVIGFPMYFVHPVQIALDYLLPLLVCGLASLLWPLRETGNVLSVCMSLATGLLSFAGIRYSFPASVITTIAAVLFAIGTFVFTYWYLKEKKSYGIVLSMLLKYLCTVLSGAYYWAEGTAAGSVEAWTFSLSYNLGYNFVTMIVCIFAVPYLIQQLNKTHTAINV